MKFAERVRVVEAFRLGIDPQPDWFTDLKNTNQVTTHNDDGRWRGGPDYAILRRLDGSQRTANFGDYVIKQADGELWCSRSVHFHAVYQACELPDVWAADGNGGMQ